MQNMMHKQVQLGQTHLNFQSPNDILTVGLLRTEQCHKERTIVGRLINGPVLLAPQLVGLYDFAEHDDQGTSLLPDHSPKVRHRVREWPCLRQ